MLDYAIVRYDGGYNWEGVYVNTGDITITNSTFSQSAHYGLTLDAASPAVSDSIFRANYIVIYTAHGAHPTLHDNRISNNTSYGVYNSDSSVVVDAENNSWGGANGPKDTSDDRSSGGP